MSPILKDSSKYDGVDRWSVAVHTMPMTPSMIRARPNVRITEVDGGFPWIHRTLVM